MTLNKENIGYLFVCSNKTQKECIEKNLFGATREYLGWITEIKSETTLFLYNTDSKTIYGPFKAASQGQYNINPRAWENVKPLEFPAQVIVKFDLIGEIRNANKKFPFLKKLNICKLSKDQTEDLIKALELTKT